jgi:hypothetical protein
MTKLTNPQTWHKILIRIHKPNNMKKTISMLLLIAASYLNTQAQETHVVVSDKTGWHKIGETTVDFTTEREEIVVVGADKFSAIEIMVKESPIHLISYDIYFENGERQSVAIGREIKSPGETGIVNLNAERSIKKIVFLYKTFPSNAEKKARLELWGMKMNPDKKKK